MAFDTQQKQMLFFQYLQVCCCTLSAWILQTGLSMVRAVLGVECIMPDSKTSHDHHHGSMRMLSAQALLII